MNILLLYISPNKTTAKISRVLQERLVSDGHNVVLFDIGKPEHRDPKNLPAPLTENTDLIGIGSPVFHMRIINLLDSYLCAILPRFEKPIKSFIYLTYGGITTGKAFLNTSKILKQFHIPVIGGLKVWAPHFYRAVPYPDDAALKTIETFCQAVFNNGCKSIPWQKTKQLFSYQTQKVNLVYPLTHWIGKLRELPIEIDQTRCILCQRCVRECPSGALTLEGEAILYQRGQCIFCYHCTTVCSQQAVLCPTEKVDEMLQVNKKIIGCEQPTNAVYF